MPDRGRQVRLPEAAAAVDQERVVVRAGSLGDRLARAVGEAVRVSDDECLTGKLLSISNGNNRQINEF